jgi:hypothetical protein
MLCNEPKNKIKVENLMVVAHQSTVPQPTMPMILHKKRVTAAMKGSAPLKVWRRAEIPEEPVSDMEKPALKTSCRSASLSAE